MFSKREMTKQAKQYAAEMMDDARLAATQPCEAEFCIDPETALMRAFEESEAVECDTEATAGEPQWTPPADPDALPF